MDGVATAGKVEPSTPTGLPRAKPRHSTNSTVSCGCHTLTDYFLHIVGWLSSAERSYRKRPRRRHFTKSMISVVLNSCPALLLSESIETPKRKGEIVCVGICQPVLDARSSHCLCACFHREVCPVHRCFVAIEMMSGIRRPELKSS